MSRTPDDIQAQDIPVDISYSDDKALYKLIDLAKQFQERLIDLESRLRRLERK